MSMLATVSMVTHKFNSNIHLPFGLRWMDIIIDTGTEMDK
jgi:hypothetical protein